MNTFESILAWVWVVGSTLLAVVFATASFLSLVLAAKRRRSAFLGLAGLFLIAAAISTIANPIANLILFHKQAYRNTHQMVAEMRQQCPVGHDGQNFISMFGKPLRTRKTGELHVWTYDANPWWLWGWTEIEVGVVSNKIIGHWLED